MERVGVLVHPTRPVQDAVRVLDAGRRTWLELVQIPAGSSPGCAPGEVGACDLIAALGGDGTSLKALHAAGRPRTPVLGVAYGSLGVLTTVRADELRAALDRFAAGDWLRRDLPALDVGAGAATSPGRSTMSCWLGGRHAAGRRRVRGRGALRSHGGRRDRGRDPGGFERVSMAAGGPLLAAGINAVVCTPLAMHGGCAHRSSSQTTEKSRSKSIRAMAASISRSTGSLSRQTRIGFRSVASRRTRHWS